MFMTEEEEKEEEEEEAAAKVSVWLIYSGVSGSTRMEKHFHVTSLQADCFWALI